jgi:nitrate reductase delta subunit
MLGNTRRSPQHLAALDAISQWTRARFRLPDACAVVVTEMDCALPGCPPLETVVAFWSADNTRHHFKIFKPARTVVPEDLPYSWMLNSLAVPEGFSCECC